MAPGLGIERAQQWIAAGLQRVTPWRVGRVVASGVLLAAATIMYFGMTSGDDGARSSPVTSTVSQSPSTSRTVPAGDWWQTDIDYDEDEYRFDAPYYDDFRAWKETRPLSTTRTRNLPEDAWRADSPYYDDFRDQEGDGALASIVWQCYPEDEGSRIGGLRAGSKLC